MRVVRNQVTERPDVSSLELRYLRPQISRGGSGVALPNEFGKMKRPVLLYSVVAVLLTAGSLVFSQSLRQDARQSPKRPVCDFDITGFWRTNATSQLNPVFFDFSPKGYVMLMGHAPNALPQDFEQMDSVNYKLDSPSKPKMIEFTTGKGNDFFLTGLTLLNVLEYKEDSFSTRNIASGEELRWERVQTHRYFITFVGRGRPEQQGGLAFVMWTMMDGRETKDEPLGAHVATGDDGSRQPVFGLIPTTIYDQIREQTEEEKAQAKEETVVLRFELTGRDFKKTHIVFEAWDKLLKDRKLPAVDAYINAMDLITQAANTLEPCGQNVTLQKLDRAAIDDINAKYKPSLRPLEYIKTIRQRNIEMHVPDRLLPRGWRPTVQFPQ